jgi:hypothetical protein
LRHKGHALEFKRYFFIDVIIKNCISLHLQEYQNLFYGSRKNMGKYEQMNHEIKRGRYQILFSIIKFKWIWTHFIFQCIYINMFINYLREKKYIERERSLKNIKRSHVCVQLCMCLDRQNICENMGEKYVRDKIF